MTEHTTEKKPSQHRLTDERIGRPALVRWPNYAANLQQRMSTYNPSGKKSTSSQPTRHTKQDALSDRDFQLLLEGASRMRDYYGFQARFVILVGGRLGLRAGEIAHLSEDWVDWCRNMIEIPRYDPCTKGRDGGPCGYCRQAAKQRVEHNPGLELDDALEYAWSAKTDAAAREVPWDHDPRVSLAIERFFDEYDSWPVSRQAVNRRVKKAAELADDLDPDDVYPHCLRGTAATRLAARGMSRFAFQAMFGWADSGTAERYIATSGENTARALHAIHSR